MFQIFKRQAFNRKSWLNTHFSCGCSETGIFPLKEPIFVTFLLYAFKNDQQKSICSSMITITFINNNCIDFSERFGYVNRRSTEKYPIYKDIDPLNNNFISDAEIFGYFKGRCCKEFRKIIRKGNSGSLTQNVSTTSKDALPKCFSRHWIIQAKIENTYTCKKFFAFLF